ncbi:hypothetical protein [Alteromonas aestuariivivens]|uniref:hypothetical protein n=1 Tax=Alteromonas aestuariivivens TaxID=1938339 RepID=UPI0011C08113|nr:hypothetical protein [Alteromonas aestuariivivens]
MTFRQQAPHAQTDQAQDQADVLQPSPSWFDNWQQGLTNSMDYTVQQLDSFFALEGSEAYQNARAEGRIRLGWEPRSRDMSEVKLRFRIRVQLPSLKNRVDLLLSDNEEFADEDSLDAVRDQSLTRSDNATVALRFKRREDSKLSFRVGAGRRDQLYTKTRYRDSLAINQAWSLLYDAEAYYYTRDHWGSELGGDIQYVTQSDNVFRFNNRFYFRDITNDWLWRHELQHLQVLTQESAAIYTLYTEGLSQPNWNLDKVYASFRWRTNPLREWLFFEVEPFVLWLRDESFEPSYGVALRVEAHYGKDS